MAETRKKRRENGIVVKSKAGQGQATATTTKSMVKSKSPTKSNAWIQKMKGRTQRSVAFSFPEAPSSQFFCLGCVKVVVREAISIHFKKVHALSGKELQRAICDTKKLATMPFDLDQIPDPLTERERTLNHAYLMMLYKCGVPILNKDKFSSLINLPNTPGMEHAGSGEPCNPTEDNFHSDSGSHDLFFDEELDLKRAVPEIGDNGLVSSFLIAEMLARSLLDGNKTLLDYTEKLRNSRSELITMTVSLVKEAALDVNGLFRVWTLDDLKKLSDLRMDCHVVLLTKVRKYYKTTQEYNIGKKYKIVIAQNRDGWYDLQKFDRHIIGKSVCYKCFSACTLKTHSCELYRLFIEEIQGNQGLASVSPLDHDPRPQMCTDIYENIFPTFKREVCEEADAHVPRAIVRCAPLIENAETSLTMQKLHIRVKTEVPQLPENENARQVEGLVPHCSNTVSSGAECVFPGVPNSRVDRKPFTPDNEALFLAVKQEPL